MYFPNHHLKAAHLTQMTIKLMPMPIRTLALTVAMLSSPIIWVTMYQKITWGTQRA